MCACVLLVFGELNQSRIRATAYTSSVATSSSVTSFYAKKAKVRNWNLNVFLIRVKRGFGIYLDFVINIIDTIRCIC